MIDQRKINKILNSFSKGKHSLNLSNNTNMKVEIEDFSVYICYFILWPFVAPFFLLSDVLINKKYYFFDALKSIYLCFDHKRITIIRSYDGNQIKLISSRLGYELCINGSKREGKDNQKELSIIFDQILSEIKSERMAKNESKNSFLTALKNEALEIKMLEAKETSSLTREQLEMLVKKYQMLEKVKDLNETSR